MKIKLLFLFFIASSVCFGQKDKYRKYKVISVEGKTEVVYGKTLDVDELGSGFKVYDSNGDKLKSKITPMSHSYLIFEDDENVIVKLKSIKNERKMMNFKYKNSFMRVLIDKSVEELKNGAIGFYRHDYFVSNGAGQGMEYNLYFEDGNGSYRVDRKKDFKNNPDLLGEELYKKMKKSKKSKTDFLCDYFKGFNNNR